jgi:alpha-tubulin suppressor-like RCC1 family protein
MSRRVADRAQRWVLARRELSRFSRRVDDEQLGGAGQRGDWSTTKSLTPVQVPGLTGVTAVAVGWLHVLALRDDGTVWAWGSNQNGQLGDGTAVLVPATVSFP